MRILVAYYSDSGNTEKIARAIYEEVSVGNQAQLKKIKDVKTEDFSDYDVVFVGGPCQVNDLASPVKKLLNLVPVSPKFKLAGFFTHMSPSGAKGSYERCIDSFEKIRKEKKIDFKGYYECQGKPTPQVEQFVRKSMNVPEDVFKKGMAEAKNHPSAEDLKKAKEFARGIVSKK